MDMADDSVMGTPGGASGEVATERDDEPTWQHRTVPSSQQAANNGSQYPEWIDGIFSACGRSENVTAWHPLAASRRTSAAARSTSNKGRMPQGMNRSG